MLDGEIVVEVGPRAQTFRVRAGEVLRMPRGTAHVVRIESPARFVVLDRREGAGDGAIRHVTDESRILRAIDRAWARPAADALGTMRDLTDHLDARTLASDARAVEPVRHTRRMVEAKRWLERESLAPPSLEALAARAGTSRFHLLREFKRHFGFTPFEYVQFLRLERLFSSLVERGLDRTLLELSGEAGFGDYSTFQRRIRETFRRTPSELLDDGARGAIGPAF